MRRIVGQGVDVAGDRQAGFHFAGFTVGDDQLRRVPTAGDEHALTLHILGQGTGLGAIGKLPGVEHRKSFRIEAGHLAFIPHRQEETAVTLDQQRVDFFHRHLMGPGDPLLLRIEFKQRRTIRPPPADDNHLAGGGLVHRTVEVALRHGDTLQRCERG
ncbi:hypothetical protein HKK55_01460 [Pseudomonas sp. ADAK18]|uniref:glucokinase n=1 Tax=Pseudomonas sp. ADAK18 TaxID=2730848 RepID=UPI001463545F|nr:hypothetical protein HKK55_01460 [Pseudomonas sp. ADAK18]